MSLEDTKSLFTEQPVVDLAELIQRARDLKATRLLLLAGKAPVCRIGEQLSPPLTNERLHFSQTESLANAVLSETQKQELDKSGSIEFELSLESGTHQCSVFYGNGSHNIIVFLPAQ